MAFTNFYVDTGGADNAAGSVVNAAASVTSTNGSWDITADTFIATAATPFSGVSVGDWASIYVDGGTVTTYVAQVTGLHALGLGVILSTTAKYGTKPSASATARSCKIGGSWRSELVLAAGGLATTTVPGSTKINIKNATYTVVASRTISMAGATTTPLWFSGYNTTPGDLDADTTNTLTKPLFSLNATFAFTLSGAHQIWSGIRFLGSRSGTICNPTGVAAQFVRCRFENTSSNAAAIALTAGQVNQVYSYCYFKAPGTATTTGVVSVASTGILFNGCVCDSGGQGFNQATNGGITYFDCVVISSNIGILSSTGTIRAINCTFYNMSTDAIKWSGTPANPGSITGCVFDTCGGIGINNASGVNTNLIQRSCNDFHSCSGGNEVGFGDSPAFFGQTDAASIVTSATDATPIAGSAARNNGFPGIFENESYSSYLDIGAVQHLGSGYVPQVME